MYVSMCVCVSMCEFTVEHLIVLVLLLSTRVTYIVRENPIAAVGRFVTKIEIHNTTPKSGIKGGIFTYSNYLNNRGQHW